MQERRNIIVAALVISVVLMLAKFTAYAITSSNFILTDAAESIVNVLASAFAFFSIYLSARPRDINHPYGHGKVEFFSAFIEGILIAVAGIAILLKSVYNLFYPHEVHKILTGAVIIGITGAINGGMGYYMIRRGKALNSVTLDADGRHLITDMITSGALVVGLTLIYFLKYSWLDSSLSIAVGIFIIVTGYRLIRKAVGALMDEADFTVVKDILVVLNEQRKAEWIDIHNLRAQRYGQELHIDCHMTLPNYFDLNKVHEEVAMVDKLINSKVSVHTELFTHADPCLPYCCNYCSMPNCPIRSEPKSRHIIWTMENITRNKKHFED